MGNKVHKPFYLPAVFFGMFLLISGAAGDDYAPNLVYDELLDTYIRQLVGKHSLNLPPEYWIKPMTASVVMKFLHKADSLRQKGDLSKQEALMLDRLKKHASGESKLFSWYHEKQKTQVHLGLSLIGDISPFLSDSEAEFRGRGILRPEFTGSIGNFSFYSQIDVWTEARSDTVFRPSMYQPYEGLAHNLYGRADSSHIRSSDILRGGVVYRKSFLELSTAVDYIRQGPAVFYPLTFSGNTPPITFFRASLDLSVLKYFQTVGQLRTQKDKKKFVYTHRLQAALFDKRITIGLNEVIINGSTAEKAQTDSLHPEYYGQERDLEWIYLIPFVSYSFAEHYGGDRDNAAISFDLSVQLPYAIRMYGEMFLDDISNPLTLFSDDFGNKWAATIGLEHFNMFKGRDIHTIIEYSRVEPWVYTHFFGGSHRYTHYGSTLGAELGPNSDALMIRAEIAVHKFNTLGLQFERTRKNSTARGGNVEDVFQAGSDSVTKQFLGEGTTKSSSIGLLWSFNPFGRFRAQSQFKYYMDGKIGLEAYGGFYF